jgi:hypothetical protein
MALFVSSNPYHQNMPDKINVSDKAKGKAFPLQAWTGP